MEGRYYVITRLSKFDLRNLYKDNKEALEIIESLTDTDMEYLAEKMADDYLEQLYWSSLKTIFEDLYRNKKAEK